MIFEEMQQVVQQLQFGPYFKVHVEVQRCSYPAKSVALIVALNGVPMRETGRVYRAADSGVRQVATWDAPLLESLTADQFLREIRQRLHTLVTHEMDENFYFRGHRIFDPHAPAQKSFWLLKPVHRSIPVPYLEPDPYESLRETATHSILSAAASRIMSYSESAYGSGLDEYKRGGVQRDDADAEQQAVVPVPAAGESA